MGDDTTPDWTDDEKPEWLHMDHTDDDKPERLFPKFNLSKNLLFVGFLWSSTWAGALSALGKSNAGFTVIVVLFALGLIVSVFAKKILEHVDVLDKL